MNPDDTEDFDVAGYYACRDCHTWCVQGTQNTSSRLCSECAVKRGQEARVARLNYEVEGRTFDIGPVTRIKKKKPNPNQPLSDSKRLHHDASNAAVWRLVHIHRALYEILLAEEKVRRGLDPTIRRRDLPPREIADELVNHGAAETVESVERGRDLIAERHRRDVG